jgi:hypothetical protein
VSGSVHCGFLVVHVVTSRFDWRSAGSDGEGNLAGLVVGSHSAGDRFNGRAYVDRVLSVGTSNF